MQHRQSPRPSLLASETSVTSQGGPVHQSARLTAEHFGQRAANMEEYRKANEVTRQKVQLVKRLYDPSHSSPPQQGNASTWATKTQVQTLAAHAATKQVGHTVGPATRPIPTLHIKGGEAGVALKRAGKAHTF